jgi:signal transduction histidine kinase/ligand-binding sensor domain-containing protein/DNA-binding response OmpR family regulator
MSLQSISYFYLHCQVYILQVTMKGCFAIITIALLLLCITVFAQHEQYPFLRIGTNNGLSHNRINCIVKDSKGFMWFGTMSGLNRYDGYQFRVFRHDLRDSTSLIDDYISRVMEGPDGKLWVETRSGLNIFDPVTETFNRNPQSYLRGLSLPDAFISNIIKDQKGNYWLVNPHHGLFKYTSATRQMTRIWYDPKNASGIGGNNISAFEEDAKGDFWMIYQDGAIEKMDGQTHTVVYKSSTLKNFNKNQVLNYNLFIDDQDELWIYVSEDPRGVFYFNPATNTLLPINKETGKVRLNTNIVTGILQDGQGKIWIGTDHGGVNLLDKKDFSIQYLMNNMDDDKSLSQNAIMAMYEDNSGIIWIGTYKQGINYYHENSIKFSIYRHQLSDPNSLTYDDVNRFAEDEKGNLWIGTNGGGLIYFDRKKNKFTQFIHKPEDPNSLSNDVIVSLWIDYRKKLWIGTYFGGLDCYDGKKFTHFKHDALDRNSLSDDRIWEIFEDSEKNLWIGTRGGGLDLLDREKNIFHHYTSGDKKSIGSDLIFALMEDKEGNFWIGTMGGIDVRDKGSGRFIHFVHDEKEPKSLSNNNVLCIEQDSRNLVWIGTREGLNLFDKKNQSFQTYRTEDGLPDNTILNIVEDDEHHLWISTPNGVSKIFIGHNEKTNSITLNFKNYDVMDGLQAGEFNENAAYKTRRGELIFGGAKGFNVFYPDNIATNKVAPAVVLTDFQIFNKSIKAGEKNSSRVILDKAISETKEITLSHSDNVISIEFAALNFSNTEKNKYAYILEPFNKQWVITDAKTRKATYTNLDPGDYVFRVKATNEDGIWNEEGVTLKITVLPPFWKTRWAYILYAWVIIGALWFARHMILLRARMRFQIEQERKEAKRMHELDLMKIRFFTNVSHEFRTPLSLILTPVEKMMKNTQEEPQKKYFQLIHRNAKRLLNLVNQLLDFRRLEMEEIYLNPSEDDIIRFTRDIIYSFSDIAEKKNICFEFHTTVDTLTTSFDKPKVERILFNLLSNAFKFTPEYGCVSVEVNMKKKEEALASENEFIEIHVKDTGIGMPAEKREKIFERFFQYNVPGEMINAGSGIGLAITKEFVRLHGGTIVVESEPSKGSCFSISLPVTVVPVIRTGEEEISTNGSTLLVHRSENDPMTEPIGKKGSGKKFSVLLIDDNEDFLFYLKDNLRVPFTILEARNGNEGWQKVLSQHPDLVVSDILMPEMDGIDLCRKIKEDPRTSHIPVILLTARSSEDIKMKGYATGANDYITKPFNFEILFSRINNLLIQQENLKKNFQKQIEINPGDITVTSADEKLIGQALAIVQKNMDNTEFSVEDLSKAMFMSRANMYKKISALTGITPVEFIRSVRIKHAAQLLEKTQMTVSEIAFEVGFNNPKYFVKYFKEEFNSLPTAYRSAKRQQKNS